MDDHQWLIVTHMLRWSYLTELSTTAFDESTYEEWLVVMEKHAALCGVEIRLERINQLTPEELHGADELEKHWTGLGHEFNRRLWLEWELNRKRAAQVSQGWERLARAVAELWPGEKNWIELEHIIGEEFA